jgi:hypothetical protein
MQRSAETLIEFLVGVAIEGIGGAPIWAWQSDQNTGIPDGPLLKGRLFYGEHHDFFVRNAGQEAADRIRDSLVIAKARSALAREHVQRMGALPKGQLTAATLRGSSLWYGALLVGSLLALVAVSLWAREKADEATRLGWPWRVTIVVLAIAPSALGFGLVWLALERAGPQPRPTVVLLAGMALSSLAMLVLPFVAAFRSREAAAPVLTAWRGNLRRVLPVAVVLLAALSLPLGIAGRVAEARWVREFASETEMARVVRIMGQEWTRPEIPDDAWRAEYPPTRSD